MLRLFGRTPTGRTVRMGTDVAAFALYEPDALAHRRGESFTWWLDACAYHREASEGRLAAWTVGSDGGYVVRLAVGDGRPALSPAEAAAKLAAVDFRLRVRTGRVRLDNLDSLPARDQTPVDDPEAWTELAPGPYRVRVHALDAAVLPDGSPTHVVLFERVGEDVFAAIPVGGGPPDLSPWSGPRDLAMDADARLARERDAFQARLATRFVAADAAVGTLVAADAVVLPGEHRTIAVPFAFGEAWMDLDWDACRARPCAVPLGREAGALVSVVETTGSSLDPVDGVATLTSRGIGLAALAEPLAPGAGERAVVPVALAPFDLADAVAAHAADRTDPAATAAFAAAMRAALERADPAAFARLPDSPTNDLARLEGASADVLTGYALRTLALPERERARLYFAAPSARIPALVAALNPRP